MTISVDSTEVSNTQIFENSTSGMAAADPRRLSDGAGRSVHALPYRTAGLELVLQTSTLSDDDCHDRRRTSTSETH